VGQTVEGLEALVHRYLQDGGRGVQAGVHHLQPLGVPAAAAAFGANAAVPGRGMPGLVEAPEMQGRGQGVGEHQ